MNRVSGKIDSNGYLKQLGEAVRTRRSASQISQESLAHITGIDRSHMGKIERGERNVTVLNLIRIAQALECTVSQLLADAGL